MHLSALRAAEGNRVCVAMYNISCYGAITVFGLLKTPGGYDYFISKGEGYLEGKRVKSCPEVAEKM